MPKKLSFDDKLSSKGTPAQALKMLREDVRFCLVVFGGSTKSWCVIHSPLGKPSMPILKDHLEIESTFALGIFAWKVFDHMALRLSLKRQNESFGNVFWKGFGIYGICGLLHTFYDDHWGPTRNRFPNTFLERYHIRDTKIWKISITTWTLSWRHPFKTVVKEPSKSCRNLSNRNIHDSTSKVIPVIHVSLLENGDCQPTLGNTWGYTS